MSDTVMMVLADLLILGYLGIGLLIVCYFAFKGVFRRAFKDPVFKNEGRMYKAAFVFALVAIWPIFFFLGFFQVFDEREKNNPQ